MKTLAPLHTKIRALPLSSPSDVRSKGLFPSLPSLPYGWRTPFSPSVSPAPSPSSAWGWWILLGISLARSKREETRLFGSSTTTHASKGRRQRLDSQEDPGKGVRVLPVEMRGEDV
ncbi:hypothetical protein AAC387_Pa04g0937 [Persea americana]